MVQTSRLAGVVTWVLRRRSTWTEVLLVRAEAAADAPGEAGDPPAWGPVRGSVGEGESEARAALRSLDGATGLRERRVYVAPLAAFGPGPGMERIGIFVAVVPDRVESPGFEGADVHVWLPIREAARELHDPADRAALAQVEARFVRASPDESLRIA